MTKPNKRQPNKKQLEAMLKDTIAFKENAIKRNSTVVLDDNDIVELRNAILNYGK